MKTLLFKFNKDQIMYFACAFLAVVAITALVLSVQVQSWKNEAQKIRQELVTDVSHLTASIKALDGRLAILNKGLQGMDNEASSKYSAFEETLVDYEHQLATMSTTGNNAQIQKLRQEVQEFFLSLSKLREGLGDLETYVYGGGRAAFYNAENGFSTDCEWFDLYNGIWAQRFTTGLKALDVMRVRIYSKTLGSLLTLRVDIYEVNHLGFPIGAPITSSFVDPSNWGLTPNWHGFSFATHPLTPKTSYALVLRDDNGTADNCVSVGYQENAVYDGGTLLKFPDSNFHGNFSGEDWERMGGHHAMGFEVWGILREF